MPELARLENRSVPVPSFQFAAPPGAQVRYATPEPTTEPQSTAAGFAALAESLAKLPENLINAYQEGKREKRIANAEDQLAAKVESGDLTGLEVEMGPKGTQISLNKADPYAELKAMVAAQGLADKQRGPQLYRGLVDRAGAPQGGGPSSGSSANHGAIPPLPTDDIPLGNTPGSAGPVQPAAQGGLSAMSADLSAASQLPGPAGLMAGMGAMGLEAPKAAEMAAMAKPSGGMSAMSQDPIGNAAQESKITLDPNTGLVFTRDAAGRDVTIDPTGKVDVVSKDGTKGMEFTSLEAAKEFSKKHGFLAPNIHPKGGKFMVEEFKPGEEEKRLTESEAKILGYYQRADGAEKDLAGIKYNATGAKSFMDRLASESNVANFLQDLTGSSDPEAQRFYQAASQFINGINRRDSGATISEREWKDAMNRYFPRPGDAPATVEAKTESRRRELASLTSTLPSYALERIGKDRGANAPAPAAAAAPAPGKVTPEAIQQREALLQKGTKADGTPLTAREKAAVKMLLDREKARLGL